MRAITCLLKEQSFSRAIRRTPIIHFRFSTLPSSSVIYPESETESKQSEETNNNPESETESKQSEETKNLSFRIEKLDKSDPVSLAFRSWMGDGFPVHRGEISHIINRFRRQKYTKRALEVMEWVIREKPYKPKELDYANLLEFTMKLHGLKQAEALFIRVPSEFQNELVYNNLVLGCLGNGLMRLALEYMKKMRELGHSISYLVFNRLIILCSPPGRKRMIPKILLQMKADKVFPDVSTYNILLKIEANEHDITGLMKVFDDMNRMMIKPDEITYSILAVAHAVARLFTACEVYAENINKSRAKDNWSTYDILLIVYGYLGNKKELEKTWGVIQELPHVRTKSYIIAIEAFGKADLVRAEELWREMESVKGLKLTEQFNSMISVYCKHGLITKATQLYKDMQNSGCKANSITLRSLALGTLKAGLVEESIRTLELAADFVTSKKVKNSTPWLETTFSMLEIFADNGDIENTEKLFEELKMAGYSRYTFTYNALLKAYVKAKIYEPNLLSRMILDGSTPDSETYSLVKLIERFRSS